MIAAVLNALPLYFKFFFRVPKGKAEAMVKITRDFLWDEVDGDPHCHLVAWEQVCKPKDREGLGIGNICLRNRALLRN